MRHKSVVLNIWLNINTHAKNINIRESDIDPVISFNTKKVTLLFFLLFFFSSFPVCFPCMPRDIYIRKFYSVEKSAIFFFFAFFFHFFKVLNEKRKGMFFFTSLTFDIRTRSWFLSYPVYKLTFCVALVH